MKPYTASAICLALTLSACSGKISDPDSQQTPMTVDVTTPMTDSIIIKQDFPGNLTPNKALEVVARVNGIIEKKYFDDGQYVTEGQILFSIEDTSYRAAVEQAEAQLATAMTTADYASRQAVAMQKAYASQAVSQMDVIKAESAAQEAQASIKSAQAALTTARTKLGYCTVRALTSGHIAAPNVVEGQFVAGEASPQVLTTIYNDSTVSANFSIDESTYQQIISCKDYKDIDFDKILVTFNDSLPNEYFGILEYVAPDVNLSTGTVKLRIKLENPDGDLKSGMYAHIHLPVSVLPDAMLVHDSAITSTQAGNVIYIVNDSNRVVTRQITTGPLYNDTLRVITSGLTPKDRYVTRALLKVRDGMTVTPRMINH